MTNKLKLARQFIEAIPHSRDLGMVLTEMGEGVAVISMPYDERLIGDPETGVISGGAVSALMDTCCGAAVMSHPENKGGTATIDLRIDYIEFTPVEDVVDPRVPHHAERQPGVAAQVRVGSRVQRRFCQELRRRTVAEQAEADRHR